MGGAMIEPTLIPPREGIASTAPNRYPTSPNLPKVYVVSDVRLYRDGLAASLARRDELEIVGSGTSSEAIEQIERSQPQVLLLDLAARDCLALPRRAITLLPALRIIAFAVEELEDSVLACARAGVCGYVARNGSVDDLVAAITAALKGELLCSPKIAALLFSHVAKQSDTHRPFAHPDEVLTPREREIARLVAFRLPNKEIARRLRLGPATVKNHVHSILRKLHVRHRTEVARLQLP
jgi:two-component system nitrate/nitrite response regulator NarL